MDAVDRDAKTSKTSRDRVTRVAGREHNNRDGCIQIQANSGGQGKGEPLEFVPGNECSACRTSPCVER